MTEIILTLVIISLVSLVAWLDYNNRKERSKLVNLIASKSVEEAVALTQADKPAPKSSPNSDLVSLGDLDDETFNKVISQ